MKLIYLILFSSLFSLSSCGPNSDITFDPFAGITQNSDDTVQMPDTLVISGTFTDANDRKNPGNDVNRHVFCISQGEYLSSCTAEINQTTGYFECDGIYEDAPVSCFLRESDDPNSEDDPSTADIDESQTDETEIIGTIEFKEDDDATYPGYLSRSTLTLSFVSGERNIELGNLDYEETNPLISTNYSNIVGRISPEASPVDLSSFHESQKTISCIETGDTLIDSQCEEYLNCQSCINLNDLLYFKKIPLTKNSENTDAISIWAGLNNFNNCGEVDLNLTLESFFEDPPLNFTVSEDITVGNFDNSGGNCRSDQWVSDLGQPVEPGNLPLFKNLAIPQTYGSSTNLYNNSSWNYSFSSYDCDIFYINNIEFFKASDEKIYGLYYIKKYQLGSCVEPWLFFDQNLVSFVFKID